MFIHILTSGPSLSKLVLPAHRGLKEREMKCYQNTYIYAEICKQCKRYAIYSPVVCRHVTISQWLLSSKAPKWWEIPPSRSVSFSTYLKRSWFELGIHTGTRQRDRQCGLVYVSKYTNSVCKGKWRYETYDIAELKSQYQIYVVHKCIFILA